MLLTVFINSLKTERKILPQKKKRRRLMQMKRKGTDRLFLSSLGRRAIKQKDVIRKKEEQEWEKILSCTNKLENQHVQRYSTRSKGTTLESMGNVISEISSSCFFLSFPKDKFQKKKTYNPSTVPTENLSRMVKSLHYKPRPKNQHNFKTGIDPFPEPASRAIIEDYRPMSATAIAYDNLHP